MPTGAPRVRTRPTKRIALRVIYGHPDTIGGLGVVA